MLNDLQASGFALEIDLRGPDGSALCFMSDSYSVFKKENVRMSEEISFKEHLTHYA